MRKDIAIFILTAMIFLSSMTVGMLRNDIKDMTNEYDELNTMYNNTSDELILMKDENNRLRSELEQLRSDMVEFRQNTIHITSVSRGGAVKTPRLVSMSVSAYDADIPCTGKTDGITASGTNAQMWRTIAAPPDIPFGTTVYIPYFRDMPNNGIFIVEDRGGAIKGNKLDIFMDTHELALGFGRRQLDVYIME